jgi:hypothetical protein
MPVALLTYLRIIFSSNVSRKTSLSPALGAAVGSRSAYKVASNSATQGNKDRRLFLRADMSAPYGDLPAEMNALCAQSTSKLP